jgi:PilZ domain
MKTSTASLPVENSIFSAPTSIFDRRGAVRLELGYPVSLSRSGEVSAVAARTENLSSKGFYCVSERPFAPQEELDCELVIPRGTPGHLPQNDLVLRGVVEVVRVVAKGMSPGYGLACQLKSYTICPKL